MSEVAIRAEIVSVMQGITDIGVVVGRRRLARSEKELIDKFGFKTGGKTYVRGWTVMRTSTPEEIRTAGGGGTNYRLHTYTIDGYWSFKDAEDSESDFQAMVETICDTFRPLATLNGKASRVGPPQVNEVGHRVFGDALVHYAELELTVTERVSR